MKSLWFVVLCYIFSVVSGFSPFREDHRQCSSRQQYDLSSSSSSFDGSIDYSTATDHEDEEFDISFNTLRYLFQKDTKTRSRSSSSDRTNSKDDNHDNTFEVLSVRSPHFSFVNVMERNDKDDDEEEEDFSVHWYEYIDAVVATEDVDTDLVVDVQSLSSNKISSEEDSSVTSSMFSLEDRYESDDEDVEIPFVVVATTTAPNAVNESKEATNLDRRMHSLGMISVHCEMEMLKFK
mmetsp:Transcript_55407/g.134556  ORF Transcript_55407/g.134556 Transcript_55407/m.134556 type:complete len:236 (+) Transcript_55407:528-1235(+)|eukprot:CAMPEP_0113518772 /NCGR_PEP_ID=MMETSP0014_2-20120614/43135_1 /TAXON_ID=2857 /ORGANISM="Nitzschia sp." /LENGTH=235 /DNA_ID=CAMNT_0000416387 /DNA_START=356 /DNA_END=1063 /DNA_ORIENTATION=- /assembly_acc=CAM_ASM_000159